MTLDDFKKRVAEGVSDALECDYSDAEAVCMTVETQLDAAFYLRKTISQAVTLVIEPQQKGK